MEASAAVAAYGSIRAAARKMGVNESTVRRRLKKAAPPRRKMTPVKSQSGSRAIFDNGKLVELSSLPERVLCVGDTQAPYHHIDSIAFIDHVKSVFKPDLDIFMGDEVDFQFLKKSFMTSDSLGPTQELERSISFMQELFKVIPKAYCLTSNHVDQRIGFAQSQGNIPSPFLRSWSEICKAPDSWQWRDYVIAGTWLFEHGHKIAKGSRPNLIEGTMKRFHRPLSIMRGHWHTELGEHIKPVWGADFKQYRQCFTGCLMNQADVHYSRDAVMLGCVVLIRGVPHTIRMATNRHGRWIGKLVDF